MTIKPNTKTVIDFLQAHEGENFTAADVAEATGLTKKQVDGIFTSAIQRKELGFREAVEVELDDGSHATIKLLRLNDAGMAIDTSASDDAE